MSTPGPLSSDRPERVAVVIPARNEEERIAATIAGARTLARVDLVVVVDDGSTDATSAIAMGEGALVVRHKSNRGKAAAMATGAQLVAIRDGAERADGGDAFSEELHTEARVPGHTGPLPVIDAADDAPRALLFLDADMGSSAIGAQPLVDVVLDEGVDMAVALLPPQTGAGGRGLVVRTARRGIQRATGWEPAQPLSGTRCITRETWDACQPLAPGWGVETSLTIDALRAGFWVREVEAELHHRARGNDMGGQLHRAAQLRDVVRALARRRGGPGDLDPAPTAEEPAAERPTPQPPTAPAAAPLSLPSEDEQDAWTVAAAPDPAPRRRAAVADLPVQGDFSDDETRALGDVDVDALDRGLRALPVRGPFRPDDVVFLAGQDLDALAERLRSAPVEESFTPDHAVIIASHHEVPEPQLPPTATIPLTADEYTSLIVHAAVDAENASDAPRG